MISNDEAMIFDEDDVEGENFKKEFEALLDIQSNAIAEQESMNSRLIGAFFVKVRWDKTLQNVDLKGLTKLASSPKINNKLHKIIQCGRRYIREVCQELSDGNTIVRRRLMKSKYNSF